MDTRTQQIKVALRTIQAIAEAIRELSPIPEGHLYAHVIHHLSLAQFQWVIDRLVSAGVVQRKNHELSWVGDSRRNSHATL